MTTQTRLIVLIFFITAFILVAPALIFYTIGYRYNWQKNKIEQVGALLADTLPKEAALKLNNEPLGKRRPLRLSTVKPNYYTLRAELDGYFPWQKNIEIKSRETTLFYDIVLFKQNTPLLIKTDGIELFELSPEEDEIAYFKNNTLWLGALGEEKPPREIYKSTFLGPQERRVSWSPDGELILLEEKKGGTERAVVIDPRGKNDPVNLGSFITHPLANLTWGADSGQLYGSAAGKLYAINVKSRSLQKLAQDIDSFSIIGDAIFISKNTGRDSVIYERGPLALFDDGLSELASLPPAHYRILANKNNFLAVGDKENNIIYLIDLSDSKQPLLRVSGSGALWGRGNKNNYLYYHDNSELWLFDPKTKKTSLLSRYSDNIKKVLPIPNVPYFLIQNGDNLQITELDDRDARQSNQLFTGRRIDNVVLDKKGEVVYFIAQLKNGSGLFRLDIR